DLGSIVDNVASRLRLPADLSAKLPAGVAHLTGFQSDQLSFVQKVGKAIQSLALWLTIIVPILFALAIFLARGHRRRTLLTVGCAGGFAGVLIVLGRNTRQSDSPARLPTAPPRPPTVPPVISINPAILDQVAAAVILGGLVLVAAA